jgi:electron transfer flavoprotein alpha subunit
MSILILAEHDDGKLNPSVQQTVTSAKLWNKPIHVLVVGNDSSKVSEQAAALDGVAKVLHAQAKHFSHPLAEDVANVILAVVGNYEVILAANSAFSRNALPRVAALLDVAMLSDVLEIKANNTYVRSIYAGNILTTVQSMDSIQVLTIHNSNYAATGLGNNAEIVDIETPAAFGHARWVSGVQSQSDRPALSSARVVISGGRSLGSAQKFEEVLSPLATRLGAALGATRAAVDAGFAPNDIQVGQTGVVVAPELYIAVGISGAVQHTYGMKDSRIVVAINQDPDAAIFQVADYGLVADLFEAIPAITAAIQ